MIDTIKLFIPEYSLSKRHSLTVIPPGIDYKTGENVNSYMFANGLEAGKVYYNDPLFNINSNKNKIFVTISVPRYSTRGENNINTVSKAEFIKVLESLEMKLKEAGIYTEYSSWKASRLDLTKNIQPKEDYLNYYPLFDCMEAKRMKVKDIHPNSHYWKNTTFEIVIYPKYEDCISHNYSPGNMDRNTLRAEIKATTGSRVKQLIGSSDNSIKRVIELYEDFPGIYSKEIKKRLFDKKNKKKILTLEDIHSAEDIDKLLIKNLKSGERNKISNFGKDLISSIVNPHMLSVIADRHPGELTRSQLRAFKGLSKDKKTSDIHILEAGELYKELEYKLTDPKYFYHIAV